MSEKTSGILEKTFSKPKEEEYIERMVFLSDATDDENVAADIRELILLKNKTEQRTEKGRIETQLTRIRDLCGVLVNVENSTVIYKPKGVLVHVNGVWKEKDGKPYSMFCTLEDWLNFGKPFTSERRSSINNRVGLAVSKSKPPKYKTTWD